MASEKFYPVLTDIFSLDKLPEQLDFISDKIESITENLFYTDLIIEKNALGDSTFIHLNIWKKRSN
jgi:hypothetical protein